jgi:hypothetical protein
MNLENFEFLEKFRDQESIHFLEIGYFDNYKANSFLRNYLTSVNSTMTCIIPLVDIKRYQSIESISINEKMNIHRGFSILLLPLLEQKYHFIYINGDHRDDIVWMDAILSFDKLLPGGIMVFDYWSELDELNKLRKEETRVKIYEFLCDYQNYIYVIETGIRVVIQKIRDRPVSDHYDGLTVLMNTYRR